jgi:CubicO group peptidase (beta-lactamase class C family)
MATTLRPHLTDHRNVAIGLIEEDGTTRAAGFGADENTDFEIGSVTKTFTAALVMDAVDRGEITLDATVADVLGSGALGSEDRTLAQLASHTAGLPGLPTNLTPRTVLPTLLRRNPYEGYTVEDLREAARTTTPGAAGTFAYSNFSVSLEGLMVAEAAGSTWQDLVTSRLLEPLGLSATYAPRTTGERHADAPRGHDEKGHRAPAWPMDGIAPAGAIRSTLTDMLVWLSSMLDGSNPGRGGLDELTEIGEGQQVGVNWFVDVTDAGTVIWHNGETGGFHAFCGYLPDTGRGLVLLTDTAGFDVDSLCFDVLTGKVGA